MTTGDVTYCRRWNFDYQEPIDLLSADQALTRDLAGQLYSVVIPGPAGDSAPEAVIEIEWENGHAGVWFFDEHGRQALNYAFRRTDDDRLFLHNMMEYTYPDANAETLSGATRTVEMRFAPDGLTKEIISDDAEQQRETIDRSDVDVSSHWETKPQFGKWESLARYNREEG